MELTIWSVLFYIVPAMIMCSGALLGIVEDYENGYNCTLFEFVLLTVYILLPVANFLISWYVVKDINRRIRLAKAAGAEKNETRNPWG